MTEHFSCFHIYAHFNYILTYNHLLNHLPPIHLYSAAVIGRFPHLLFSVELQLTDTQCFHYVSLSSLKNNNMMFASDLNVPQNLSRHWIHWCSGSHQVRHLAYLILLLWNICGSKLFKTTGMLHYSKLIVPLIGAVGSGGVHQGRKGHRVAAVCGNDSDTYWGSPGCVSQTDEHWQAAHLRGNRQCSLCVPAAGKALHGPHHNKEQQHPGGPGDPPTLLSCGKEIHWVLCAHIFTECLKVFLCSDV